MINRILYISIFMSLTSLCAAQVELKTEDVRCFGQENGKATLTIGTAPGPYKIIWRKGDQLRRLHEFEDQLVASGLSKGNYSVTIEDKNRCTIKRDFIIKEPSKLKLNLNREELNIAYCDPNWPPFYITATPSGGVQPYDCKDCMQLISPPGGRYYFSVIDSNKCVARTEIGVYTIQTGCSSDPNDIIGPDGIDSCRWMSNEDDFNYTIRFENDPIVATAPAQLVFVEYPIDPNQNGFSLNIGSFGWGEYTFEVPANINTYQKRLDFVDEHGFFIDVLAGLNVNNNTVFWRFETIDPNTGLRPVDPQIGFLPINDSLTGIGEGFVAFSMKPTSDAQTGDSILATADIIFDANEAIVTNTWTNKIDAVAPTSSLSSLPSVSSDANIMLQWTAADDMGGSGLDLYRVFASQDGNAFDIVGDDIRADTFLFIGQYGSTYDFYVQAVDRVGNTESKNTSEQSVSILDERNLLVYAISPNYICENDSFDIQWTSSQISLINIEYSIDTGATYLPLVNNVPAIDEGIKLFAGNLSLSDAAVIRIVDASDLTFNSVSPFFKIVKIPNVEAGADVEMCYLDAVYLDGSGANEYSWSHGLTLSDSTDDDPRVYADQTTMYLLEGTDVNGCVGMDAVTVTVHLPDNDTLDVDICLGDSIYGGGGYQNQSGVYSDTFQNSFGCDSMVTLVVTKIDPCVWNQGPYVYVDLDATGVRNGSNWMDAYHDVQDALKTVKKYVDAKEIWIAEGEYSPGADRISTLELSDSIKIFGGFAGTESSKSERPLSGSEVVLTGEGGPAGWHGNNYHVVTIDTSCTDCVIDGLRITAGNSNGAGVNQSLAAGVLVFGKIELNNVTVSGNRSLSQGSVYLIGSAANLSLINSHIENNSDLDGSSFFNAIGTQIFMSGNSTVE